MPAAQAVENPYAQFGYTVAEAAPSERAVFVRKTYTHLAMAVYAFVALEWCFFKLGFAEWLFQQAATLPFGMMAIFGLFLVTSWVADSWARSETSVAKQYAGLMGYVAAEAVLLAPMLWYAQDKSIELGAVQGIAPAEINVVAAAGLATLLMFAGLTAIAWFSRADFSFLSAGLSIAGVAVFALIIASYFLGWNLGTWFSVGMIVFASAYILYDTSNVMHHYRPTQHVAASLALFASVALLFYYLLRLFIALSSRD